MVILVGNFVAQPVFAAFVQQTRAARRVHAVLLVTVAMLPFPSAVWSQDGKPKCRHADIVPEHGGELLMALGDALRVRAHTYTCYYDVCTIEAGGGRPQWTTNRRALAVSNGGVVRAARAGSFALSVRFRGFSASRAVRVLPPVRNLTWSSRPVSMFVGDTLHIGLIARDSGGQVVHRFGASEHQGGTDRSGEILWWDHDGLSGVLVNRPGLIVLVGYLAHRSDTIRILAVPRK